MCVWIYMDFVVIRKAPDPFMGASFNNCRAIYLMRKGTTWSRVLADGTTTLSMTKKWPGRWKSVPVAAANADGPPNKTLQPTIRDRRRFQFATVARAACG